MPKIFTNRIAHLFAEHALINDAVISVDFAGKGKSRKILRVSLTQEAYDYIGTNTKEWQLIIRNEKQPDMQQAEQITRLLGVEITELYEQPKAAAA